MHRPCFFLGKRDVKVWREGRSDRVRRKFLSEDRVAHFVGILREVKYSNRGKGRIEDGADSKRFITPRSSSNGRLRAALFSTLAQTDMGTTVPYSGVWSVCRDAPIAARRRYDWRHKCPATNLPLDRAISGGAF